VSRSFGFLTSLISVEAKTKNCPSWLVLTPFTIPQCDWSLSYLGLPFYLRQLQPWSASWLHADVPQVEKCNLGLTQRQVRIICNSVLSGYITSVSSDSIGVWMNGIFHIDIPFLVLLLYIRSCLVCCFCPVLYYTISKIVFLSFWYVLGRQRSKTINQLCT